MAVVRGHANAKAVGVHRGEFGDVVGYRPLHQTAQARVQSVEVVLYRRMDHGFPWKDQFCLRYVMQYACRAAHLAGPGTRAPLAQSAGLAGRAATGTRMSSR